MSGISEQRRVAFYGGTGLTVLGLLLFLGAFVGFASDFGSPFRAASGAGEMMGLAVAAAACMAAGGFLRRVGARGLAGSGVVLDPEKARKDLEPYSRMAGGMVRDALDGLVPAKTLKCAACGGMNEQASKFCGNCGANLGRG